MPVEYTTETLDELIDALVAGEITPAEYTSKIGMLPPSGDTPDFTTGGQIDWNEDNVPDFYDEWSSEVNYWEGFQQPAAGFSRDLEQPIGSIISDPSDNWFDTLTGLARGLPPPGSAPGIIPDQPSGDNPPPGGTPPMAEETPPPAPEGATTGDLSPEQRTNYEKYVALGMIPAVALALAMTPAFNAEATATPDAPNGTLARAPLPRSARILSATSSTSPTEVQANPK